MYSREDQTKVRRAIVSRRVDPSDVPASARAATSSNLQNSATSAPSQKKRKAEVAIASSQSASQHIHKPSATVDNSRREMEEEAEEANAYEEEVRDELYCVLRSKIVGTQYYSGLVGPGEEVRLVREPHNKYDGYSSLSPEISIIC